MKWLVALCILFYSSTFGGDVIQMSEKQKKVKSFLHTISKIESSGGKDMNHKRIDSGIHKGTSAIGRYGLMPNTVSEVLNRMRRTGGLTPQLKQLQNLDPETMKKTLEQNPELENQIAEALADRVLDKHQDDTKAAFSWNQGHNLSPEDVEAKKYEDSDYVRKYKNFKKLATGEGENQ